MLESPKPLKPRETAGTVARLRRRCGCHYGTYTYADCIALSNALQPFFLRLQKGLPALQNPIPIPTRLCIFPPDPTPEILSGEFELNP